MQAVVKKKQRQLKIYNLLQKKENYLQQPFINTLKMTKTSTLTIFKILQVWQATIIYRTEPSLCSVLNSHTNTINNKGK